MGRPHVVESARQATFPIDGGATGAAMRAFDWTLTSLGRPETWPTALRVAINLILNSPESMYLVWGPDQSFFFNDAYRPILGPRLGAALGSSLPRLWADVYAEIRPIIERALAGEASRYEDLPLMMARHGKAERTWWTFSFSPLYDETGSIVGVFCVTNETTSRVLGAVALHASNERYRAVFESAIDYAIVVMDLDGMVTNWNEGAKRTLGWSAAEMHGRSCNLFFTPEDVAADIARREMHSALLTGRGIDERWHLRKDGSRFWANGEMLTLRNDDDEPIGFMKILRDRTEQRNAIARLEASEANLRKIVETVPVGIMFAEAPSGRIVGRNGRLDEIVGPSSNGPQAVAEYSRWISFHTDGRQVEAHEYPLARVIHGNLDNAQLQVHYQRRDGRRVWLDIVGAAIRDAEGVLTGAVVTITDIDVRMNAEAHQTLMNQELSHRMKNLMAMVLAVTNQTMRGATDVAAAREVLSDRLIAMSKAHDLLLGGAETRASIADVVRQGVGVHDAEALARFDYGGPPVEIEAGPAVALTMMMHELSTNAAKYGALSVETGRVEVAWSLIETDHGLDLRIAWRESGGPRVVPPARKGFGTRLIERGLTGYVGGSIATDYAPGGLVCTVQAPLAKFVGAAG